MATVPQADARWAAMSHWCGICAPLVGAAVIRITIGRKNAFVGHHSAEALNFQLLFWGLIFLVLVLPYWSMWLRLVVALPVFVAVGVSSWYAAKQARAGRWWRYPVSIKGLSGPARNAHR